MESENEEIEKFSNNSSSSAQSDSAIENAFNDLLNG